MGTGENPTKKQDNVIGQTLDGRFKVLEYLSEGGMGQIYKAKQINLDRLVAIKVFKETSRNTEEFKKRFFLEASLCGRLTHPNIVRIFDYGCHEDDIFYIAMEYLQGTNLQELLKKKIRLDAHEALFILKALCEGLVEAHGQGLVHRDLKPANIFLVPNPVGGSFVKILDFGVVKQLNSVEEISKANSTVGSPLYMSPEQIRSESLDSRSDIYALGVTLYQMLTGKFPFRSRSAIRLLQMHLSEQPPAFSSVLENVYDVSPLEEVTRKAMEKEKDDRYANVQEMLVDLNKISADLPADEKANPLSSWEPEIEKIVSPSKTESLGSGFSETQSLYDDFQVQTLPTKSFHELLSLRDQTLDITSLSSEEATLEVVAGHQAFIDYSCPFCFVLHERLHRWGFASKVEWHLVEHASHVFDGPFDLAQEEMLAREVFEVRHRAADVELLLPAQRCRSTIATRLTTYVQERRPEKAHAFRLAVYRTLWQNSEDIGSLEVLQELLRTHDLPLDLLDLCQEEPARLKQWQQSWEEGNFDHSIPVIFHPQSGRSLVGLADEETLKAFLFGDRTRVVDNAVCLYQHQPSLLVCGSLNALWELLSDFRSSCNILQSPNFEAAKKHLSEMAVPDFLIIEKGAMQQSDISELSALAQTRSIPWVLATANPSTEEEIDMLSIGAVEYLTTDEKVRVSSARLGRILRDRYHIDRMEKQQNVDTLTELPSRKMLIEQIEVEWARAQPVGASLSFLLLDLDRFKAYNRAHGYISGDQCLVQLAKVLKAKVCRPGDFLARFGGNQFALLLPATSNVDAKTLAADMARALSDLKIESEASATGFLAASVGVHTLKPSVNTSVYDLVDRAWQNLLDGRH